MRREHDERGTVASGRCDSVPPRFVWRPPREISAASASSIQQRVYILGAGRRILPDTASTAPLPLLGALALRPWHVPRTA